MATLLLFISSGKGSWKKAQDIIQNRVWDQILVLTNSFGKQHFRCNKQLTYHIIPKNEDVHTLKNTIINIIKGVNEDIHVNVASGTGNEHTALFLALKQTNKKHYMIWEEYNEIKEST